MSKHHAVILDEKSFNSGDLDLSNLLKLVDSWDRHLATSTEQRFERLKNATIAIANKVVFDKELLEKLPRLKIILLTATGMDNIDLNYCKNNGIITKNVTDYCSSSVAQHVFSLMLALSTQLISYQDFTKKGGWTRNEKLTNLVFPIQELSGKTLGLIGYGNLAKGVEKLALAFGMKILIAQRVGTTNHSNDRLPLNDLLAQVDVLSIHCPLTDGTTHLISTSEFQQMKPTALLINTARGAVVDNTALAHALRNHEIAGAGIDVLDQEPPPSSHPLLADDIPNLILTPHIAWAAVETRQRVIDKLTKNLENYLKVAS